VTGPIEEHRAELAELCRRYRVRSLSLFGSATPEDFDPDRSNFDFLALQVLAREIDSLLGGD